MPELLEKDLPDLELEKGQYGEAQKLGISFTDFLATLEEKKGYVPAGDAAKLDPFERQLTRLELDVNSSGKFVEDFFSTVKSVVLFPEYISRQVNLGMLWGKNQLRVEDIVSGTETISSGAAKVPGLDFPKEKAKQGKVAEGAGFPKAKISFKLKSVDLYKIGIQLDFTYESVRRVALPVFNIMLQRIGYNLARQKAAEAMTIMKDGDGNTGSAATPSNAGGTWSYAEYVKLILSVPDGYEFTTLCVNKTFLQKMLTDDVNFKQFQSRGILERFLATGELIDFMGVKWTYHNDAADETILIWDNRQSLISYREQGAQMIESDRVIDKQLLGTVISDVIGFSKPFESCAAYKTKS